MMNFDVMPPRQGTRCDKWDGMSHTFGEAAAGDVIPLWVADMDFACAPEILSAVRSAYDCGALGYRYLGDGFYAAIAGWMKKRHGLDVPTEWILPLPGVVSGISAAVAAFTDAGDGVIIQTPVYTPFHNVPRNMGRKLLENPLVEKEENGILRYEIDFEHLAALCADESAKVLVLCSPHNPVGRLYTPEELARIAQICAENDVFLISEEIHSDIVLDGRKFTPILAAAPQRSRICQLGSPSKSFNTAGTHSAYMIIPDAEERAKVQAFWHALHIPTESFISAEVITAAYNEAEYYVDELCPYVTENMHFLCSYLREHLPKVRLAQTEATYLLWADFSAYGTGKELMDTLVREARVAPDPGDWFGSSYGGYLRINVAAPRSIIGEAAKRIVRCFG